MPDNLEELKTCKRCGRVITDEPLKVSDEVLREYTRCVLGQKPFTRIFTVLNGSMKVHFEALDGESELIVERYTPQNATSVASDASLILCLSKIEVIDPELGNTTVIYSKDGKQRKEAADNLQTAVQELAQSLDAMQLGVVRRAALMFNLLCSTVMETMLNEDFYGGVGLY